MGDSPSDLRTSGSSSSGGVQEAGRTLRLGSDPWSCLEVQDLPRDLELLDLSDVTLHKTTRGLRRSLDKPGPWGELGVKIAASGVKGLRCPVALGLKQLIALLDPLRANIELLDIQYTGLPIPKLDRLGNFKRLRVIRLPYRTDNSAGLAWLLRHISTLTKVVIRYEASADQELGTVIGKLKEHKPGLKVCVKQEDESWVDAETLRGLGVVLKRCTSSAWESEGEEQWFGWGLDNLRGLGNGLNEKIKVALLDTGVSAAAKSLRDKVTVWESCVSDELACDDADGHGTACASLILDKEIGTGADVDLIVIKIMGPTRADLAEDAIAEGIKLAVKHKADIISLSAGQDSCNQKLYAVVQDALARGIIFVTCASNFGRLSTSNILYPARFGGLLCIGAHNRHGKPVALSSVGREVDFLAPGIDILVRNPSGDIVKESGTSFATPLVAGLCALLLAYDRTHLNQIKNTNDMRNVLLALAAKPGQHDEISGYGALAPNRVCCSFEVIQRLLYQHMPNYERLFDKPASPPTTGGDLFRSVAEAYAEEEGEYEPDLPKEDENEEQEASDSSNYQHVDGGRDRAKGKEKEA